MLASVFGVSFDEHLAMEFADCPQLVPRIQNMLAEINIDLVSEVQLGIFVDDVLYEIASNIAKTVNTSNSNASTAENLEHSFGELFGQPELDHTESLKVFHIYKYLNSLKTRCDKFMADSNRTANENLFLTICKKRIDIFVILALSGLSICVEQNEAVIYFTDHFRRNQIDAVSFLRDFASLVDEQLVDEHALFEVFNLIFTKLRYWTTMLNVKDRFHPLMDSLLKTIHYLISLQHDGKRLLANLLAQRDDFSPVVEGGREFLHKSYLGPILEPSVVDKEEEDALYMCKKILPDQRLWRDQQRFNLYTRYQTRMQSLRLELYGIIHILLVNIGTREKTMNYLSRLLSLNRKRTQIHADHQKLASNGVMMNVLSVMLHMSEKIMLDRVQDFYFFHPANRVDVADEARISFAPDVLEVVGREANVNYEAKFTTECFYLTIFAMNVCMNASLEHWGQQRQHLGDLRRALRDLNDYIKRKGEAYSKLPMVQARLNQIKAMENRISLNYLCNECLLKDEFLVVRCAKFVNQQLAFILRSISVDYVNNTLPAEPPKCFGAMPEFYIESALDFMTFLLREFPDVLLANSTNIAEHLLVLSCCLHFFKNPYLASKDIWQPRFNIALNFINSIQFPVVNVVFMTSPIVTPKTEFLFRQIVDNNFAGQRLFASLSKFYTNVESTGAHTEFYDKFNIRRSIQVIFKCMWTFLIHRRSMIEVAQRQTPEFIRFINMVINDTTFLLDESLSDLKKIRDIEALMENENEFNALTEEDQKQKQSALTEAMRTVRMWMILCNDTLEFFILLTTDNARIFYNTLGERVAAMLNYNIVQLCGPKCAELKVKDAKARFEWDPRKLLEQIVQIYLNLSSETFAENIAQDERSYMPETFAAILDKISSRRILEMSQTERFKNLLEMAERYYREKAQEELDFGDDIPNEFIDELVYTLMSEPMRLPSGQFVDKKHIMRHLLSDKTNPFTRQPLTFEELVPDFELKQRIEAWVAEKKAAARRQ